MAETEPRRLGKYEIVEEIGRGGFGVVYKAIGTMLKRTVALKVLAAHLLSDPAFIARFQHEAQMAAGLEHPHIVTVWEVGEVEGTYFIAMRYVDGRPLSRLLADEGPLPLARVAHLLDQIAAALDYAHGHGVTHRDLKPSNILVDAGDRVTVTDFGLAKASSMSGLTRTGQVPGTPAYMAPEQLDVDRQQEVGPASDIYALGLVVYEMLAGAPPFVGPTPALIAAHLLKEAPSIRQQRADLPVEVGEAIDRALAKSPAERPRSAEEMAAVLRAAVEAADRERQQARLAQLYEQGMQHLAAEQWEAAEKAFAEVVTDEPTFRDAAACLGSARRGRALAEMYGQVRAAAELKDWPRVVQAGTELLSRAPGYGDTAGIVEQARRALAVSTERRRPLWLVVLAGLAVLASCGLGGWALVTRVILPNWRPATPAAVVAEPTPTPTLAPSATWTSTPLPPTAPPAIEPSSTPTKLATATPRPTDTPTPTATPVLPTSTRAATPSPTRPMPTATSVPPTVPPTPTPAVHVAVSLRSPADGSIFSGADATIVFQWDASLLLAEDEYYVLNIWYPHGDERWHDVQWTKQTSFGMPDYIYANATLPGVLEWYVVVMRETGMSADGLREGVELGPRSETWTFEWLPGDGEGGPGPQPPQITPSPTPKRPD